MKKNLFLAVLCLATLFASANIYRDGGKYKYEEKKTVEKTFDVSTNPTLEMEGKYSDFIITSWDQQQIDFKVNITVKSDNNEKLQAKIKSIDVYFDKVGNKVIARTMFGDYPYKTFNGSMSIKYYVQVPKDVFMELETKYGDIKVDTVYNKFEVDIKYGDLKADKLLDISDIDVKYGNIIINSAKTIKLDMGYSDANITKCEQLDGDLKYSNIYVSELGHGMLENKYTTVKIDKADIIGFDDNAYSDLTVRNVTNTLSAELRYTDLAAAVTSSVPKVHIDAQYSDVELGINKDASFYYNLESSYADISFKGFFDTKTIGRQGTYGEGERGMLDISTRYGDVDIRKN